MFSYIQILLAILVLHCATSKPFFGEIGFKKNFEVAFKPPPLPPLPPLKFGFLKEFWSPLGKFEIKHEIGKRDLDKVTATEVNESSSAETAEDESILVLPVNRYQVEEERMEPLPRVELVQNEGPVLNLGPLSTVGMMQTQRPVLNVDPLNKIDLIENLGPMLNVAPLEKIKPIQFSREQLPAVTPIAPITVEHQVTPFPHHVTQALGPVVEITPVPAPPRPPVVISPIPPKPKETGPAPGLFTNIARDELINEYLKAVEPILPIGNSILPEKPKKEEVPPEEPVNPFVRGSRLAFYFGNILVEMLSQFLGGQKGPGILNRPISI